MARESKWSLGRSSYALIGLPFLVLAVVMMIGGNTGLGAAYIAIGVTFVALSVDGDGDDGDDGDAAEEDTGS